VLSLRRRVSFTKSGQISGLSLPKVQSPLGCLTW
jgi:hypothetical protein